MTMKDSELGSPGLKKSSWEQMLQDGHRPLRLVRTVFRHLPSNPRCKLCIAPFGGLGGKVVGLAGFGPSRMNPNFCSRCLEQLPPGGAEVELAVLFADVRGSTQLGGAGDATAFAALMNRFYSVATQTLIEHDALIDKLIGDEVMALFLPGLAGPQYRQKACDAALGILAATASDPVLAGALGIGVGVHAGRAFVGNVGGAGVFDFTALGDTVNVAARLQSEASTGELVLSDAVYQVVDVPVAERRTVLVKGKSEPIDIHVVRP